GLVPTITRTGLSVSPASGAAQDFTGPVTYTVTAQNGSTAAYTVTVTEAPLTTIADIGDYFTAADGLYAGTTGDPIPLPVALDLADTGWTDLLGAIDDADKFVALDLSACGMTGEFDPGATDTDADRVAAKGKIVSLVLPEGATGVKAGDDWSNPTFKNFTALKSIAGTGIETIGEYAFFNCTALTTVSLDVAESIGDEAFRNCTKLTTVSLPMADSIGEWAFAECIALEEVSLPAATSIGNGAFQTCIKLTTVSLPEAASIGNGAFIYCTALEEVSLDVAESIGDDAFRNCTALETVSLPKAESIGVYAFLGCTALEEVSLPKATSIGDTAFACTGTKALTVTLGDAVPTLGTEMFYEVTDAKTVTVKVPSGASGYGSSPTDTTTDNWGNGFRGRGWRDGDIVKNSDYVNSYITLTIEEYTP
ncbi:MAG: leucine-rich repeat domain-containing protein, partial [Spirochaetaceae bacterium]|nr:leucine-rich repeat domain-containing protein [Spirochaetaceae bacterium]